MYVTREEFRASPTVQATNSKIPNENLETLIEQASRYFDLLCGVSSGYFEPPATGAVATARTFYGDGTNYLALDPYRAGSLSSTITVPSGYTAPDFVEREGYLVLTSTEGVLPGRIAPYPSRYGGWFDGVPITVEAIWGYDDDSAAVKGAVIELAIHLLRTRDPAETQLTDLGTHILRETAPPRVLQVAKSFQRKGRAFLV